MDLYTPEVKERILVSSVDPSDPKQAAFAEMLKCPICRGYIAVSMKSPLRCPGKDSRIIDGKRVAYTSTGIPWDEYVKAHKDRDDKRYKDYVEKHRDHLIAHGIIKG